MPWFWIWTFLVLATLGLAFLLLRDLWRKARALLDELGKASEVLEQLTLRTEELTEALEKVQAAREEAKTQFPDVVGARANMAEVRRARRRKKAARKREHGAKRRTWRDIAIDPRFDRWRKQ